MQSEGFSLNAQRDKLIKYAEYSDMVVVREYSDAGSGKNIVGRPNFSRMMEDIKTQKDDVDFVLVYKLSRFGRNSADVLTSLQILQDFGANLICTEDSIDSSKDSGKLLISVLSAVSEIERENILTQTMEGRKRKAKEGKWNGGFAPYGYKLVDGELHIADDEAEVIKVIYEKFVNTTKGINSLAKFLNESTSFEKKLRQNNRVEGFSFAFVKRILDNPIYCGKIAYGRRKNEKKIGTRNEFHIVKQKEYPVYEGIHKGIVSETLWNQAQDKRRITGIRYEKKYNLDHANILSGILKCPICGASMYGNVNRKKRKDGSLYKSYFYYACKHRLKVDGHNCGYRKQLKQEKIDNAVAEIIFGLVKNPMFKKAIKNKINSNIDTREIERELKNQKGAYTQTEGSINKLAEMIDSLNVNDPLYDRKFKDLQNRLDRQYEKLKCIEIEMKEKEKRILNIKADKIKDENVYRILVTFDKIYPKLTDQEKKELMGSFLESVEILPSDEENGRILKSLKFAFPIFFDGIERENISWDNATTVECVVKLEKR
jgi:site-specific DNA recombinase